MAFAFAPACGDGSGDDGSTSLDDDGFESGSTLPSGSEDETTLSGSTTLDTGSTTLDTGTDDTAETTGGGCNPPAADAQISGTVYAPNQEIPVSGALVYTTNEMPDGIPQTVYCAECVELDCAIHWGLTAPDGSFAIPAGSGQKYLVVQKGQFMRIVEIDIAMGNNALGPDLTSLPDHNDPTNGLYIPSIAVGFASYDRLEDGLAKLGLGDLMLTGTYGQQLVPGTEQFDLWANGGSVSGITTMGNFGQLIQNYALMEQYHIIFIPCSSDTYEGLLQDPTVQANIRNWTAAGGKWYASDWSNEMVEHIFPQYQTLQGEPNNADISSYDSTGTLLDQDMIAWMQALPDALKDINPANGGGTTHPTVNAPSIELVDNWSAVNDTPPVLVDDGMGGQIDVGHKVWVESPHSGVTKANAITAPYGCGKIMFTTYHTAEFSATYTGLTPQELVLMYLILEIGVCQTETPIPPAD